jgi:hypothetical protein
VAVTVPGTGTDIDNHCRSHQSGCKALSQAAAAAEVAAAARAETAGQVTSPGTVLHWAHGQSLMALDSASQGSGPQGVLSLTRT